MDSEFSLHFGPVTAERGELVLQLERLMSRLGAWPEGEVRRLALVENSEGHRGFEYVDETIKGHALEDIVEKSRQWDGVHLGLSYELASCGLLLLSAQIESEDSQVIPCTSVAMRMPIGPMYAKRNHPFHAGKLFEIVADTTEDLGAEFAVFERFWQGRSRTLEDVDVWLDMVESGEQASWEWVMMREFGMAYDEVSDFESADYGFENYAYRQLWVASRWPHFRAMPA